MRQQERLINLNNHDELHYRPAVCLLPHACDHLSSDDSRQRDDRKHGLWRDRGRRRRALLHTRPPSFAICNYLFGDHRVLEINCVLTKFSLCSKESVC